MKKILLVDDDGIIAEIYRRRLEHAGYAVEVAEDGLAATRSLLRERPDVVVLDLMMPRLSGIDVLRYIRSERDLQSITVIILSNFYLANATEEAAVALADRSLLKSKCTPSVLLAAVAQSLAGDSAANSTGDQSLVSEIEKPPVPAPKPPIIPAPPPPPPKLPPIEEYETDVVEREFQPKVRREFLESVPTTVGTIEHLHEGFALCTDPRLRPFKLLDLYRKIHFLTSMAGMAGCAHLEHFCSVFEALLFELHEKPHFINASTLRTIETGMDFLVELLKRAGEMSPTARAMQASVLVVDDDAISDRVVVAALHRARLRATSADRPTKALQLAVATQFDLVLLDIVMPEMDGFEVCERLRAMPNYAKTPVIFFTNHSDFENRCRTVVSGGDDLISKPVLPIELAVKVTTHLLRRQIGIAPARPAPQPS